MCCCVCERSKRRRILRLREELQLETRKESDQVTTAHQRTQTLSLRNAQGTHMCVCVWVCVFTDFNSFPTTHLHLLLCCTRTLLIVPSSHQSKPLQLLHEVVIPAHHFCFSSFFHCFCVFLGFLRTQKELGSRDCEIWSLDLSRNRGGRARAPPWTILGHVGCWSKIIAIMAFQSFCAL
jgi:hypothetical protein